MKLFVTPLAIYGLNSVGWRCNSWSKHNGQGGTGDVTIHLQDGRQARVVPEDQLSARLGSDEYLAGDCLLPQWSVPKRDVAVVSSKSNVMLLYNPGPNL